MSKEVLKSYIIPGNQKFEPVTKNELSTVYKFNHTIAFEEISGSLARQYDEAIINYLYEKYKGTDISEVYVLSKDEFKEFLIKMLPVWRKLDND